MKNILEHICKGYYSDPPDVALYFVVGKDNNGLLLYHCCHGTNDVEGGVHQNLIRRFTSFSVSPHHAVNMTLEYVVTHNIQVSGTQAESGPDSLRQLCCSLTHSHKLRLASKTTPDIATLAISTYLSRTRLCHSNNGPVMHWLRALISDMGSG